MKNFIFANDTLQVFEGFYESNLLNSNTEYYLNEMLQDEEHPEEYEIDFQEYKQEVALLHVEKLNDYCVLYNHDNIIKSIKLHSVDSPKYYNFETDRLVLSIDFNLTLLKKYIKDNKEDFKVFLKEKYTSYDGYISFIPNHYSDFMEQYNRNEDKNLLINVMLEYFMLRCIYDRPLKEVVEKQIHHTETDYKQEIYDRLSEIQMNCSKVVEEV